MTEQQTTYSPVSRPDSRAVPTYVQGLSRKLVLQRLERLVHGQLLLKDPLGRHVFGEVGKDEGGPVTLTVLDPRFYTAVAFGGAVGAAEAFIEGFWTCKDLTSLVRLLLRNRQVLEELGGGLARLAEPVRRILHWLHRNTPRGSRRNISAHYDLGNDFFQLWLDETMMYSSAIFEREDMSLREASVAKLDRICRKLELSPDDHLLEIGTGWGGFAIHAARNYGCKVTTTTISREQYEYARVRVDEAGLTGQVTLLLEDYRDLTGQYDKLVSIEMIEAIGHEYLDLYFSNCSGLLKKDGMMLVQAITIADQRYEASLKSVDFIQRFIFPGGFLPSTTAILQSVTQSSDMRLYHLEDIGAHYARTLRCWRERFHAKLSTIRALGYPEKFLRMWEYYYCYCEGAFLERATGTAQLLLVKPGCRREPLIAPL